ncbi:hypothetical protein J0383_21420 [Flavobacterium endoglycinae]|uniref:DUF304 domain-containing protein n=1 Tax=Flavobacterium endoglycinae TaxID=2816357 RepID=A0ABX7QDW7_9FLAO|nr:hypothetical protein [Flavobacterium endoglycinae]QSW88786.1 hypothetical protein J0383_21420 [Flavobacterium endoglycinae]
MKRDYSFALLISIALAIFAGAGIWIKEMAMFWIFGILSVLSLISIWSKQIIIDLERKEIIVKIGLIGKPFPIPFEDFQNFELVRIKQYLLTTNTSLNIQYLKNGKEKSAMIAQGFTSKSMQNLANEIDEIIHGV